MDLSTTNIFPITLFHGLTGFFLILNFVFICAIGKFYSKKFNEDVQVWIICIGFLGVIFVRILQVKNILIHELLTSLLIIVSSLFMWYGYYNLYSKMVGVKK